MKDLVPKGTGNSRFLRSSIPENITHEELVALLRTGTFPVDFAGLNADGVAVVGSAYNKANVLPDDVCNALGISTISEPKDAFIALSESLSELSSDFKERITFGVYTGNASYDSVNLQNISLGFSPVSVFVYVTEDTGYSSSKSYIGFCAKGYGLHDYDTNHRKSIKVLSITSNGFTAGNGAMYYLNLSGTKFAYIAIRG